MEALLRQLLERRRARLPRETTCFRWVDGELPGVTVDLFGEVAVASFYRQAQAGEVDRLSRALEQAGALRAVYVKHRPREARRIANDRPEQVAPPLPVVGEAVDELEVQELGARFLIRPANGLSVGLYLDARDARAFVHREAGGRRVLNLFAYTCGFGVAARRGGAARAVNVDASRKVLDWGAANLARNGRPVDRADFIAGDAFEWLTRLSKKGERFDLVVVDPPGFATTKTSRFSARSDYHRLAAHVAAVVAPRGLVLAMCNVEAMSWDELEAHLDRGLKGRRVRTVARFGASDVDFAQPAALKCVVLELG